MIVIAGGAALSMATTRHLLSGMWNSPDRLPALAGNAHVHYEPGAEAYARNVAGLLPQASAQIELAQGRPFAHPVTIGVYKTLDTYAAANGVGSTIPAGVTFLGRVTLSPKLFSPQNARLPAILTHELSHAHLFGWIGWVGYIGLPNWFKEGLAVMVSGGGGAELVSDKEARAALQRGERIVIEDRGDLRDGPDVRLDRTPVGKPDWYPTVLAYREAGMFVMYLRDSDELAFDRTLGAILQGSSFTDAMTAGYHEDAQTLWQKFLAAN